MINVSILNKNFIDYFSKYNGKFPNCNFTFGDENMTNADVIFGNPKPAEILECTNLKWVQTASSGVDAYLKANLPENLLFTNATGAYGLAISEHMLGMHLSLIKKLHLYRDEQLKSNWVNRGMVSSIKDSTVLILGLGDIGTDYAKLVKAMGAYVIGVRRSDLSKPDFIDEIHLSDKIIELLPRADMVAIAMPCTEKTKYLINKDTLAIMKNTAGIMNIGRGPIIDTDALCDALENNTIGGACLDVTDPEPLPPDHRLWGIENLILTPHISGGSQLTETVTKNLDLFMTNLERFLNNEPLKSSVDFKEGYRKI